jgi:signal transduction histidine kinase
MKPGKLYIKIFLSFLAILCVTEIFVFALFLLVPGRYFSARLEQNTKGKALIVKDVVEDKIRSAPSTDLSKNEQLRVFVVNFGEIMGAKVWLQNTDGVLSVKSFGGDVPEVVEELAKSKMRDYGSFRLYHRRQSGFYAVIPIAFPKGEKGNIHILFDSPGLPRPEGRFALGLAIIGLIVALMTIPVSRLITKRVKQLRQSALRIADGDLSHRVAVKSKDEIGELARAFNRMTDKLEKMIIGSKELIANVSHELRTPLTRISIAEELLREKLAQGNLKEYERHLDGIREEISELDSLVGRILELSRLDTYELPLEFEILNPSDLIDDLLKRLEPVIERNDVHVKTDISRHTSFMGDRDAIRTALSNVLENAAKFTSQNGDILIRLYPEQDFLVISVTNSFKKLAEEDLARIFDPFHRVERSKAPGSGLGLTITKKIVERHGGKIESFNAVEGLEIRMTFPLEASQTNTHQ